MVSKCVVFAHTSLWRVYALEQGWQTSLRARAQIVYKFGRNSLHIYGNFEEQNKFLESSIIIINYCMIIILYYDYDL